MTIVADIGSWFKAVSIYFEALVFLVVLVVSVHTIINMRDD
jgi:sensor domain CHASE-containing protein